MAQQESIIKLKGKIGDLTFYKTKDGYQARQAKGVDPSRIANDPNYQRTRENNAEFTVGANASKRLRDTLRPIILLTYDPKMPGTDNFAPFHMRIHCTKLCIKFITSFPNNLKTSFNRS